MLLIDRFDGLSDVAIDVLAAAERLISRRYFIVISVAVENG